MKSQNKIHFFNISNLEENDIIDLIFIKKDIIKVIKRDNKSNSIIIKLEMKSETTSEEETK